MISTPPFYELPDYIENTTRDFQSERALPPSYETNTQHKVTSAIKTTLSLPWARLQLEAARRWILPSSGINLRETAEDDRLEIPLDGPWKYKRITVKVDGLLIDGMLIGKATTFNNRKWFLFSNGNCELYESLLAYNSSDRDLLNEISANGLFFNYPGVGASSGSPNKTTMAKAYAAMLRFLEDRERGIGATQIIGYGHSMGGAAQGEALKSHRLKEGIRYVFVKRQTFSNLSSITSSLVIRHLGLLVKCMGWNLDSILSSKLLSAPEIIMQSAVTEDYTILENSLSLRSDGVIPVQTSLAKILLDDPTCPKENKLFIGMPELHNDNLQRPSFVARKIQEYLSVGYTPPSPYHPIFLEVEDRISQLTPNSSLRDIWLSIGPIHQIESSGDLRAEMIHIYNETRPEPHHLSLLWDPREYFKERPPLDVDGLYNALKKTISLYF